MNSMKKRFVAVLMAGAVLASTMGGALAYDADKAQNQAQALKVLGLFQGSDKGFELALAPSRMDTLVMLLRMTGQENAARFSEAKSPFVDAPSWDPAANYLAYAHEKGLTTGVDATHFDPSSPATAQSYVTFMLRALGYEGANIWTDWEKLGKEVGLLPVGVSTKDFKRGDVVMISYAALDCKMKDQSMTLSEKLQKDGVFNSLAEATAELEAGAPVSVDSSLARIMASIYRGVSDQIDVKRYTAQAITKENMKAYLGVDNLKITEGYAVEPTMSARAHSLALIRLAAGEDVEAAKSAIAANVDPRKWICVAVDPENVHVENIGNLIFLAMDNTNAADFVKNFKALPLDVKGAVKVGDSVVERKTVDEASVKKLAEKLVSLQNTHMKDNKVYYSIIPDKGFYLKDKTTGTLDHDKMMSILRPLLPTSIKEVNIADQLSADDYYKTDMHWRQENLQNVVTSLGDAMNFSIDWGSFSVTKGGSFIGSYSRLLDSLKVESFNYLESVDTKATSVQIYGQDKATTVYNTAKLSSAEPYNVFLSELSPLTVLKNPEVKESRRLVLFGDSFATSIAPLLLEDYSEITLVDLRFMSSNLIAEHVNFKDAEVLFLYSGAIANNSALLR